MTDHRNFALAGLAGILLSFCLIPVNAWSEPYLAIREGLKCNACHTNPTGGGKRNVFGRIYGQTNLPATASTNPTDQRVNPVLDIGGNFRFNANSFVSPGDEENTFSFDTERANLYIESTLISDKLTLYVDQQFSPANENREAWALYAVGDNNNAYIKAGKMFLPFGHRLQDDSALVRSVTGINFLTPDNGVEVGFDHHKWSTQVALSNGTAGGGENNRGKQINARSVYIETDWRMGAAAGYNDGPNDTDRSIYGAFGGARYLGSEFLFEVDFISDSSSDNKRKQLAALAEINREIVKGHNLKLTFGYHDPDTELKEDHRSRVSVVWEATPFPLWQMRVGTRQSQGIPQNNAQNTDQYFVQLHTWF